MTDEDPFKYVDQAHRDGNDECTTYVTLAKGQSVLRKILQKSTFFALSEVAKIGYLLCAVPSWYRVIRSTDRTDSSAWLLCIRSTQIGQHTRSTRTHVVGIFSHVIHVQLTMQPSPFYTEKDVFRHAPGTLSVNCILSLSFQMEADAVHLLRRRYAESRQQNRELRARMREQRQRSRQLMAACTLKMQEKDEYIQKVSQTKPENNLAGLEKGSWDSETLNFDQVQREDVEMHIF